MKGPAIKEWPSDEWRELTPREASLCWDVKVGWVPVREIDPATGRTYTQSPGTEPGPQETPQ